MEVGPPGSRAYRPKAKAVEEWERAHPNAVAGAGSGFLSSMFGSVAAPGSSRPNQPMTYLEQKRAQAQAIYKEEQKYWAEHADEFKQLIEEDKARQLAEMKDRKMSAYFAFSRPVGPAENGYPIEDATRIAFQTTRDMLLDSRYGHMIKKIVFVVFSEWDEKTYKSIVAEYFPGPPDNGTAVRRGGQRTVRDTAEDDPPPPYQR